MKYSRFFTAAAAVSALAFAACDKKEPAAGGGGSAPAAKAVSEADALAAFKKASEEINTLVKEGKAAGNPAEGMPKMSAALAKMQAISLDGLPEDLKTSFSAAKDGFKDLTAAFADMPKNQEEAMAWLQKTMTDPAFGEKMQKLSETGKAATAKFKEVAAKYGITIDE